MTLNRNEEGLARLKSTLGNGAAERFSSGQLFFLFALICVAFIVVFFFQDGLLFVSRTVIDICTAFYILILLFQMRVVTMSLREDTVINVTDDDVRNDPRRVWPFISVVVAMFHEANMVDALVANLSRLEYPSYKLEVILLLEESDTETIAQLTNRELPINFQVEIRPSNHPSRRNKPGVIMWAVEQKLLDPFSKFFCIYDAEDNPDPLQLKKAVIAFQRARQTDPKLVCVQGKLAFANNAQNWLTRLSALDYAVHFNLILPGLAKLGVISPLGGTTNFILTEAFMRMGFDTSNVTEDLNLAVCFRRMGYTTRVFSSTTMEEAVADPTEWVGQRSRWLKGGLQTYVTHMRHPLALLQDLGPLGFIVFQLVVGGPIFSGLINPLFWGLTALYAVTGAPFIQALYPGIVFHLATVCFMLGNFTFIYVIVMAAVSTKQYLNTFFALLAPLYWVMLCFAAYRAAFEFFSGKKLHVWVKTAHKGLSSLPPVSVLPEAHDAKLGH